MLVLLEPLHFIGHNPVPNLGCGMLVGACAERGHEVQVIAGQEPLVRRLFVDHVDELWDLTPKEPDGRAKSTVGGLGKLLDRDAFVANHLALYRRVFHEETIRTFLTDPDMLYSLSRCLTQAIEAYVARIRAAPQEPLALIEGYIDEILSHRPDIVGFSLLERTPLPLLTLAIVARLRAVSDVPVIGGGAATSHFTEGEFELLLQPTQFDRILVGPAERALPDLLDRFAAGAPLDGAPNSVYRDAGGVHHAEIIPVTDLDALPFPDFSQIDLDLFPTPVRFLPIQSGRGCSWRKCAFCVWHQQYFGKSYQGFSVKRIVDMIEHLRDIYDTTCFALLDTELPAARARQLATALLERFGEHGVTIAVYLARLTKGFDDADLLDLMHRAGFAAVQWGLESGNERVLASMNKGTDVATGGSILEKSAAAGISNSVAVLFGFPGETAAEAQESVDYLVAHRHTIDGLAVVSSFQLKAEAPIGKHPEDWGGTVDEAGVVTWSPGSIAGPEADAFTQSFLAKIGLGVLEVTSPPVVTHHQLGGNFIHCALMRDHDCLAPADVAAALAGDDGATHVPMFSGTLTEQDGPAVLVLRLLNENSWVSSLHPPRVRTLDDLERAAVEAADGTRTMAQIVAELEDQGYAPETALASLTGLVCEAARDSWVLVFKRPWPAAKVRV